MQVAQNTVVSIDYRLYGSDGTLLDNSPDGEPVVYLHGHDNIVPGLEDALEGKHEGDQVTVTVPPEEGYGQYREELVQSVPLSAFPEGDPPQPGMQFHAETDAGHTVITVTGVEGEQVTVDANHVLAGKQLDYSVTVAGVRAATAEEIKHGHVHSD